MFTLEPITMGHRVVCYILSCHGYTYCFASQGEAFDWLDEMDQLHVVDYDIEIAISDPSIQVALGCAADDTYTQRITEVEPRITCRVEGTVLVNAPKGQGE